MSTPTTDTFDRAAIAKSTGVQACFTFPLSPEHAMVLFDKHGAKDVSPLPEGNVLVLFGMSAHLEYMEAFFAKMLEAVKEQPDLAPKDVAKVVMRKLGHR